MYPRLRPSLALTATVFFLCGTGLANAADTGASQRDNLEITFGAAYTADPRFYGVPIKPRWQLALAAEYSRDSYFTSTEHGIGYEISSRADLTVGVAINYQSDRATTESVQWA